MPESTENLKPAAHLELPWALKAAAVLAIAVPVGMLAHLGHQEREGLGETVVELEEENVVLASERDAFAEVAGQIDFVRAELKSSKLQLAGERSLRLKLESDLVQMESKVAVLGEREEALRGIIDLLEGEVSSAERRIAKLSEQNDAPTLELSHLTAAAIVASNDPKIRLENDRLRNELHKHDDQVVELLGEISVLNQELEMMREERSRIGAESSKLSQKAAASRAALESGLNGAVLAGLGEDE